MNYLANNGSRPSNNMALAHGMLPPNPRYDIDVNQYVSRMNPRPPFQGRSVRGGFESDNTPNRNGPSTSVSSHVAPKSNQTTNFTFKSTTSSAADPSRNQTSYEGRNCATPSRFNSGGSNNFIRDNLNVSIDNRKRMENLSVGASKIGVQDTVGTIPKLLPVSRASTSKENAVTQNLNTTNTASSSSNLNFRIFGSSESEKMFIFTGTVERVIKWNKIFRNHFCYFEVIAAVISIQEGSIKTQKIMLLRDKKGPILQMVYYITTHMDIEDFHVGQILRCVGKMTSSNSLNAISIRSASQGEIDTLQRLSLVCDHAVSHFLNA